MGESTSEQDKLRTPSEFLLIASDNYKDSPNTHHMNNTIDEERLVDELLERIEPLELNETRLQVEVQQLRERLQETERQIEAQPAIKAKVVPTPRNNRQQRQVIARDRDCRQLNIGDPVYILTRGVHRKRRGSIYKLGTDRVIILDNTGIQQSRAPHNVRYTGE